MVSAFSMAKNVRSKTILFFSLAAAYSASLFVVASYLPVLTKKAAAALTWVVYARIIKSLILYLSTVLFYIFFIKWPCLAQKWLFLGIVAIYSVPLAIFLARLGNSVNEYVHFPEYAALVLLWYAAFKYAAAQKFISVRPIYPALTVSAILGVSEECYQLFVPSRVFDIQDILLNIMGVWLGGLIIWVFEGGAENKKVS